MLVPAVHVSCSVRGALVDVRLIDLKTFSAPCMPEAWGILGCPFQLTQACDLLPGMFCQCSLCSGVTQQAQTHLCAHAGGWGERDEEQGFAAMGLGFIEWSLKSIAGAKGQNQADFSADGFLEWEVLVEHLCWARWGRETHWKIQRWLQ